MTNTNHTALHQHVVGFDIAKKGSLLSGEQETIEDVTLAYSSVQLRPGSPVIR